MAIYHLSMKTISRSAGRSTTAAAAYRAGVKIVDRRTGEIHDFTRKGGVLGAAVVLPEGGTMPRAELWNRVEEHHRRKDAVLAREIVIALPAELCQEDRKRLALKYASELADRYGVAVDIALHAPSKDGSDKNWHAHIMLTACHASPKGELGKKCVALDPIHCKRHDLPNAADEQRSRWAELANAALASAGQDARIDHRSHAERGLEELPSYHLGPDVTAILRRGGRSKVIERADARREQAQAEAKQYQSALDLAQAEYDAAQAMVLAAEQELAELRRAQELAAEQAEQNPLNLPEQVMEQVELGLMNYSGGRSVDERNELKKKFFAWIERDSESAIRWCLQWSIYGYAEGDIPEPEVPQQSQPAPQRRLDDDDYRPGF